MMVMVIMMDGCMKMAVIGVVPSAPASTAAVVGVLPAPRGEDSWRASWTRFTRKLRKRACKNGLWGHTVNGDECGQGDLHVRFAGDARDSAKSLATFSSNE